MSKQEFYGDELESAEMIKSEKLGETNKDIDENELFLKWIQMCSITYDYSDKKKNIKEKLERLDILEKLKELMLNEDKVKNYVLPNLGHLLDLIRINIFRPLPKEIQSMDKLGQIEPGEYLESTDIDPAWPYIKDVYEIFLRFISCQVVDVNCIKSFISPTFIQVFLHLFESEEPNERESLKNFLHRLYSKVIPRRRLMRRAMNNLLFTVIHETQNSNGVNELLDILGCIIAGFVVPLREEHVKFFNNIIIPLHKVQTSHFFYEQLLRCSMLFLSKDSSLSIPLVEGLLRYWPYGNSTKETLFLSELTEVLNFCHMSKLEPLIPKLVKRLIKCISGPNLRVSDYAIQFFEKDDFLNIVKTYKQVVFPIIVPVIVEQAENHWHRLFSDNSKLCVKILKDIDSEAFDRALEESKTYTKNNSLKNMYNLPERARAESQWETLTKTAKIIDPNLVLPILPYAEDQLIRLITE